MEPLVVAFVEPLVVASAAAFAFAVASAAAFAVAVASAAAFAVAAFLAFGEPIGFLRHFSNDSARFRCCKTQ